MTVSYLNDKADLVRVEKVLRTDARITVLFNNTGISVDADMADKAYEAARQNLTPKLSLRTPATRYSVSALNAAGGS